MYKSYIHTHTNPHTLSIVKVDGSIHRNILKATQKFSKHNKTEEFAGLVRQSCPKQDFRYQSPGPFLDSLQFIQSPGDVWGAAKEGWYECVNQGWISAENTQRYLYILLENAPHHTQGSLCPDRLTQTHILVLFNHLPL